ncbi:PAS domain S-box protein [Arenibaculum sp.]|uniref:PAS domain S-box protein n=1 Tax=Arenibaculum sp. TaxID=2865862 RepID=UPI002E116D8C|nr:PAS domain S-box protein [Arenibaculum sp.]
MNILVVAEREHRGRQLVELAAPPPASVRTVAAWTDALAASGAGPCVFVVPVARVPGEACGEGIEAVRALRAAGVPVLALAGDAAAMEAAVAAGADDVVSAAADPGELRLRLGMLARRRAAPELPGAPAGLAAFVEAMPVPALISLPAEGRILAANRLLRDAVGYDLDALLAMHGSQLYADPADRARLVEAVGRDGAAAGIEIRIERSDGTSLWALVSCRALDLGGARGLLCVFQDITERKSAEQALETRERRLRHIADALPAMVYLMDELGRTTFVNRPTLEFTGRSFDDMQGDRWQEVIHPEDRPGLLDKMRRAAREGTAFEHEYRALTADGSYRWRLNRGQPLRDRRGRHRSIIGVCLDITDRKRAQEELELNRERIRMIIETVPAPIAYIDTEDVIRYANLAYARRFDSGRDDIVGRRLADLLGEEATRMLRPFQELALRGQSARFEGTVDYDPLGTRHCQIFYVPHIVEGGRVAGYFGLVNDITETKRIEAELRRAKEAAERADDAKSRFLAAASHDLRQPLNAMSLLLGVLRPQITDPRATAVAAQMQQSLDAMVELFNALLDISRLDMGAATVRHEPVDTATLFARIETDFRAAAASKGLELRVVGSGMTVWSDPTLIERALRNLVSNAIRYTEHGRVLLGCRRRGALARIEVHDSGPGIPADRLDDIFEEFYQVGNPARERREGHGLGLAIVRRAMDLLGHRLDVASAVGRGSRFAIEVPACPMPGGAETEAPGTGQAGEAGKPGFPVLLIEDDPLVQSAMRMTLEDLGCRVLAAPSLVEALAALDAEGVAPHLVLADYRLPGGADGLRAIAVLRTRFGPEFSACVLTGDVQANIQAQVEAAGARFLRKPIRPEDIRTIVDAARHAAKWRQRARPAA